MREYMKRYHRERYASDPEYRERILALHRSPAYRAKDRVRSREYQRMRRAADPRIRERAREANRRSYRKLMEDPERRQDRNLRYQARQAARRVIKAGKVR